MEQEQAIAKQEPKQAVLAALERQKLVIEKRLPAGMTPDRFYYGLITCVQKNPNLLNCTPGSVLLAAYEAAELGVNLSPTLQLGYLIPYANAAQFFLSYRGMIQKAYETGAVKAFFAEVVYENDRFERFFAPQRTVVHQPATDDRGEKVGVYALVEFHDGHIDFEYLTSQQVDAHKNRSRQKNSMMWIEFEDEAWKKTAIRVLAKRLPLSNAGMERLAEVLGAEQDRELDVSPAAPVEQKKGAAKIRERLKLAAPKSLPQEVSVEAQPEPG